MNNLPKPGSQWRHVPTGKTYTVLDVCNQAASEIRRPDFPLAIAYYDEDRNVWARPLGRFLSVMVEVIDEQA